MTQDERQLFDEKFRGVYARLDAYHDLQMLKLKNIEEQTIKTNGRVTALEKETLFFRFISRYPYASTIIGIIIIVLVSTIFDINKLLSLF